MYLRDPVSASSVLELQASATTPGHLCVFWKFKVRWWRHDKHIIHWTSPWLQISWNYRQTKKYVKVHAYNMAYSSIIYPLAVWTLTVWITDEGHIVGSFEKSLRCLEKVSSRVSWVRLFFFPMYNAKCSNPVTCLHFSQEDGEISIHRVIHVLQLFKWQCAESSNSPGGP